MSAQGIGHRPTAFRYNNRPSVGRPVGLLAHWSIENDLEEVAHRRHETHEKGHGRRDDRYYYLAKLPDDFPLKEKWPGLKAIGMAVRVTEHTDGRASDDVRYYITSRYTSGKRFAAAVRGHWSIENSLHWQPE